MWMHRTQRLVERPVGEVRHDIGQLVRSTWEPVAHVVTTEHHGRRSDWIAADADGALDVVLTWTLIDLDGATFVTLELDELEPGPDPRAGMELMLDLLAGARVTG
jgi:hypothetical protein